MVNPKFLCKKHLLGEHFEHHMFVGTIKKGISVKKYLEDGFLEPHKLLERHDEIVEEMKIRGFNHKSPLEKIDVSHLNSGKIDIEKSLKDISIRCNHCAKRIMLYKT